MLFKTMKFQVLIIKTKYKMDLKYGIGKLLF